MSEQDKMAVEWLKEVATFQGEMGDPVEAQAVLDYIAALRERVGVLEGWVGELMGLRQDAQRLVNLMRAQVFKPEGPGLKKIRSFPIEYAEPLEASLILTRPIKAALSTGPEEEKK